MFTPKDKSVWLKPTLVELDTNQTLTDDCTDKFTTPGSDARCTSATS